MALINLIFKRFRSQFEFSKGSQARNIIPRNGSNSISKVRSHKLEVVWIYICDRGTCDWDWVAQTIAKIVEVACVGGFLWVVRGWFGGWVAVVMTESFLCDG